MLTKVLVANRGEIARRIQRTCTRLGIATVAVYSDADRHARHVVDAAEAIPLGPAPATRSYLDIDKVVGAAVTTGCDAVHPGYGFLAEHAGFARAVRDAGLIFVGPPPDVIELMGDKAAAKRRLADLGVPVLPGLDTDDGDEALITGADAVGFPLLIKAVAGGGGKGMRRVDGVDELPDAIASARREAATAFGDDRLLLERLLLRPRHVEVQVVADRHGHVLHLYERECSIQRRHQKVIEEAPPSGLDPTLRARLTKAAVDATRAVGYEGVGTVEFLVDTAAAREPAYVFLEMNPRLQVEHPVTEAITGLDLVELQLQVAAGRPLDLDQALITCSGHAIEVRICAEDPVSHLPQTGTITALEHPTGPDVRVDVGVEVGEAVTPYYDPLLAKLIVHAEDRRAACAQLRRTLGRTSVRGVTTNLPILAAVVAHPAFLAGELSTAFLDDHLADWSPDPPSDEVVLGAVAALYADARAAARPAAAERDGARPDRVLETSARSTWERLGALRPTGGGGWPVVVESVAGEPHRVDVYVRGGRVLARRPGPQPDVELRAPTRTEVIADPERGDQAEVWVHVGTATHRLRVVAGTRSVDLTAATGTAAFTAPMPGSVLTVGVRPGETVTAGDTLAVIEAMKMEHPIVASADGVVAAVHVAPGDAVRADAPLVDVDTEMRDDAPPAHPRTTRGRRA